MKIKKMILPLLIAVTAFTACNNTGDTDPEQGYDPTASVSEINAAVSEVPEAAAEKDNETSDTEAPETKKIKDIVYSDDGRTLIYVSPDRTGTFTILRKIDSIGENAFYQSQLTDVVLPEGLKIIGDNAFAESSITEIVLPSTVTDIGDNAFKDSALESIELNEGLKTIGDSVFAGTGVKDICLPESIEKCGLIFGQIENGPFIIIPSEMKDNDRISSLKNYKNILYVDKSINENIDEPIYSEDGRTLIAFPASVTGYFRIPPGVEFIAENAFYNSRLDILDTDGVVKSIGKNAFFNSSITGIVIPPSVTEIGDYTFANSELKRIRLSGGLKTIGDYAFANTQLEDIMLDDGLKTIGAYAFANTPLESIKIYDKLKTIGDYAFSNTRLTSIELNDGLTTIGDYAFANTYIKEITLPRYIENCGMIFGQTKSTLTIYAPASAENNAGTQSLKKYKNVIYRDETDLEFLLRKTSTFDRDGFEDKFFIDLNGDAFPEMVEIGYDDFDVRYFDLSLGTWKGFIYDIPEDADLHLYHDKENDVYFYIYHKYWFDGYYYIHKVNITENGFSDRTIGRYDSKGGGNKNGKLTKEIDFGYLDGKFFIEENIPDICVYEMNKIMPDCELIRTIKIKDIVKKYSNDSEMYKTVMDQFADSPKPSEYKKPLPEEPKSAVSGDIDIVRKGGIYYGTISINSYSVKLKSDRNNKENLEKLSHMPNLIYLHLRSFFDDDWTDDIGVGYNPTYEDMYEERTIDLSGIGELSGLEYLEIETDNIINTSEIRKLKNLRMLRIDGNADDLSFLADMDSLEAIELSPCSDKPADFFAPLYGLKNLKYIIYPTDEQAAHITENAPWISIV